MQSQIRKIIAIDKEITTDPSKIQNEIKHFYEFLFKKVNSKPPSQTNDFLNKVQLPKLNIIEINKCNNELSEKELYMSFCILQINKSSGNEGVFCNFLGRYKICFFKFMSYSET